MKLTLQELLNQKAMLEKHLAWLNSKIEALKSESAERDDTTGSIDPTLASSQSGNSLATAPPTPELSEGTITESENEVDAIAQHHVPAPSEMSSMTKFGCVAVIIGICLLFLFGLFILPNWLYPD